MTIFKYLLIAAMTLINIAVSSTAVSSEVAPVVTSITFITSVKFVSAAPSATSSKVCEAVTLIDATSVSTANATSSADVSTLTTTATTQETKTITHTSSKLLQQTTSILDAANSTTKMTAPTPAFSYPHHSNSSTIAPTGTGGSASISSSYASPPTTSFTGSADVTNVGAAALAGGIVLALLEF